jgi:putative membrane protein
MLSSHLSCWGRASREMSSDDIPRDPRVYLAAERTFLAWIRTGLALMAFGFVVARFGLFLRELEASRSIAPAAPSALSLPLGVGLVLLGVALNLFSSWHHVRYIRELNEGSLTVGQPSRLAIALALILAAAGLGLALYLGTTRTSGSSPKSMSRGLIPFSAGCELGCEGGKSRA